MEFSMLQKIALLIVLMAAMVYGLAFAIEKAANHVMESLTSISGDTSFDETLPEIDLAQAQQELGRRRRLQAAGQLPVAATADTDTQGA